MVLQMLVVNILHWTSFWSQQLPIKMWLVLLLFTAGENQQKKTFRGYCYCWSLMCIILWIIVFSSFLLKWWLLFWRGRFFSEREKIEETCKLTSICTHEILFLFQCRCWSKWSIHCYSQHGETTARDWWYKHFWFCRSDTSTKESSCTGRG